MIQHATYRENASHVRLAHTCPINANGLTSFENFTLNVKVLTFLSNHLLHDYG